MTQLSTPVISSQDTQTAIWFLGALSQVRLSGDQTGGAFTSATARFLTLHIPGGFEQFAAEVGRQHGITILAPTPKP